MDQLVNEQARRLESILPLILRTIYPPREDDPFAELPLMQLRVVRTLSTGPKSMSDLAEELHMSPSRLAHLITRLEAVDLVRKTSHPEDRRVKSVELTALGDSQMRTHQGLRAERAADILSSLPQEERDTLMTCLEDLYRQAKSIHPPATIREHAEITP